MAAPYRIYLVDDDRFLLDMYAVKFKAAGHEVTAYQGGTLVLEALRKGAPAPDALLLDIVMPEIDGFGVLEAIRKENLIPTTKIIVISSTRRSSALQATSSRRQRFLPKYSQRLFA
jgi:two-component system chemotaxis response regulator CheY